MSRRAEIFTEELSVQYPLLGEVSSILADRIDESWDIFKNKAQTGANNEWTLAGHLQAYIWDTIGGGAQSAYAVHHALRRITEEGLK